MNIKPLFDRVLIAALEKPKQTSSGIILTGESGDERTIHGEVVAVGPGRWDEDGEKRVSMSLSVGDKVLFKKFTAEEISSNGKEYFMVREDAILAIISEQ